MSHPWRVFFYYVRSLGPRLTLVALALLGAAWAFGVLVVRPSAAPSTPTATAPPAAQLATAAPTPPTTLTQPPVGASPITGVESVVAEVVALTNRARLENGCDVMLTSSPLLDRAAQGHSEDMAQRGYFDHISPDGTGPAERLAAVGYHWSRYGENIAAGYTSPAQVVEGWMNSPGHRANILNCEFRELGVGYTDTVTGPGAGGLLWTQVFAAP
jgi:uncharacterized protein YkwD